MHQQTGATFKESLAELRDSINTSKDVNPGLGEWLFIDYVSFFGLKTFFSLTKKTLKNPLSAMRTMPWVSNVGPLPRENLDFGDVRVSNAELVGPFMYPPGFMLVAVTFDNAMKLYANYCAATENRPVVERFFDLLEEEINSICPAV